MAHIESLDEVKRYCPKCGPCNRLIGIAGENRDTLQRSVLYLDKHQGDAWYT
jgi:hypothetical protein